MFSPGHPDPLHAASPIPTEQVEHVIAVSGYLEHYPARWNHLTGMNLRRGEARVAWQCGASAKMRNDATAQYIATGSLPEIDGIYWIDTIFC